MLNDITYKEKFAILTPLMPYVIENVKKDLKNDHIRTDGIFARHYFSGKNHNKLSVEELSEAYTHALAHQESAEAIGEFIANRWLLNHGEVYHFFEEELSKINPDFSSLEVLDPQVSVVLMEKAISAFGAPTTYLFCVLNSVVFPDEIFQQLAKKAQDELKNKAENTAKEKERLSAEMMERNHEQQIARLTDKYEKKLMGLQKKYVTDTEALKKQVAILQRKLHA